MSGASENPDLAEVKAVLRRLQRLDVPGPGSADAGSPRGAAPAGGDAADARARMSVFDRKRAAAGRTDAAPQKQSLKLTYLAKPMYLAIAGALIAAVAIVAFYELPQSQPELREVATTAQGITAAPEPASAAPAGEAAVLSEARALLTNGEVAAARGRLLASSPEANASLAFLLAQSYNSNYLRALPKADSPPSKAEAERWYRTWYDLAARSGLEMDNARFQRIIKSLQ